MKYYTLLFCLFFGWSLFAQTQSGLVAFYSMDDCTLTDNSNNGSNGTLNNDFCDDCGVSGNALRFVDPSNSSSNDHTSGLLLGSVNSDFKTNDFTVSFYIKPTNNLGVKDIISKRQGCDDNNAFAIQYVTASNSINVLLSENSSKKVNVSAPLDFGRCWQQVTFVRRNKASLLYINGVLKAEKDSPDGLPVDIDNAGVFSLSNSPCQATLETPYQGFIDDLYIYKKALNENEIAQLDKNPHKVFNNNVTIFLGESIDLEATPGCDSINYEWFPADYLSTTDETITTATPDSSILYTMSWTEDQLCIAYDTVRIRVIDPATLDCSELFLPKAFTPNGDGLNDTYSISNSRAILPGDLLSFEIYDRWGSRVFATENTATEWDGSFKGKPMNPGVFLYKIRYLCNGQELTDVGSLAIMR